MCIQNFKIFAWLIILLYTLQTQNGNSITKSSFKALIVKKHEAIRDHSVACNLGMKDGKLGNFSFSFSLKDTNQCMETNFSCRYWK